MRIKIGYYDWNQFGLKDSFYPEDMPLEWKLTFYANEIECTQLALGKLKSTDDISELFEDLSDDFDVLIKMDEIDQWPLLSELLVNNNANIKAVVCSEECQKRHSKQIASFSVPCFNEADINEADKVSISLLPEINAKQLLTGSMNIVYVNEMLTLKQWRVFIDQWVLQADQEDCFLMLDADVFSSSVSGELRMMIDMLGY